MTMEHPYAILKVAAERLVAFARRGAERRRHGGAPRLRLRDHERPTGSRTAMSSVYEAVALARRGEPIVATGPEVGRDWIHAGDVARGVMLLDHDRPLARSTWAPARNYSMRETIEMVATLVPGTRVRWTDDAREANVAVDNGVLRWGSTWRGPISDSRRGLRCEDGLRNYLAFLQI